MFELVIYATLICVALAGIGGALCRLLARAGLQEFGSWALPEMALVGIWLTTLLALLVNFAVGLSDVSGYWIISIGVVLAIPMLRDCRQQRSYAWPWLIFGSLVVVLSAKVIGARITYDTGLYHIPFLLWMEEYPAPLGLTNLEGRLGFNSSWLIFNSAFRIPALGWGFLKGTECAVWVVASCYVLDGLFRRWNHFDTGNRALLISMTFAYAAYSALAGPSTVSSTDNAPNIFGFMAAFAFIEFCVAVRERNAPAQRRTFLLLAMLVALAITGKLSLAPVMIFVFFGVGIAISREVPMRLLIPAGLACILLIISWCVRNVLLSGCLAYPVPQTCGESVSWAAGALNALEMRNEISASARGYGASDWAVRGLILQRPTVVVGLLFLVGTYMLIRRRTSLRLATSNSRPRPAHGRFTYEETSIMAVAVTGISFWFITAPAPRFCWSFLLLSTVILNAGWCRDHGIGFVNHVMTITTPLRRRRYLAFTVLSVALIFCWQLVRHPDLSGSFPVPTPSTRLMKSDITGFEARTPVEGDQCWAVIQPCTPYFERVRRLKLDTQSGRPIFEID
jgi:hypothetical protein